MKIISVVGARPNFMKIAPFIREITHYNKNHSNYNNYLLDHILVHTGQHYDDRMSKSFFKALDIPEANINLGIGSGSHAYQVGTTMIEFEKVLEKEKPDWIVVLGDVNSTLACSVTAKKQNVKVCHIEAGLRSNDMTMPEEINRLVTDRLSDLLLTPDEISVKNLLNEGVDKRKIKFVGNIMIDTLEANRKKAEALNIPEIIESNLFKDGSYNRNYNNIDEFVLMTLHRPSNVDDKSLLMPIIDLLTSEIADQLPIIWPVHPRAKKQLENFGLWEQLRNHKNVFLLEPLGYIEMLKLNINARVMLTDSGGLQEECNVLNTPCLTLRWNTERPVTLRENGGVSVLVGNDINLIKREFYNVMKNKYKARVPEFWDGQTAGRCLKSIIEYKQ
ncbi:MAG: non-hydrolyzing UDP-N-acetylglucosamine 2-epimerase [bacterium]